MTEEKLKKLEIEEQKMKEKLDKLKEEKKRIKREQAKKEKAERDAWLVVMGDLTVKQIDRFPGGVDGLLDEAGRTLSKRSFEKLKEGLVKEGVYQEPVKPNF